MPPNVLLKPLFTKIIEIYLIHGVEIKQLIL